MTGFKSTKALSDRLADAQREGLHKQNEWQLGMDKLRERDGVDADFRQRHLWPHFHRLIAACRPPVVMGETKNEPDL